MKNALSLFVFIFAFSLFVSAQSKNKLLNSGKGQQNNNTGSGTQIINNKIRHYDIVNEKNEKDVLLVDKYIDTSKPIYIKCGNFVSAELRWLKIGFYPFFDIFHFGSDGDTIAFKIRLCKHQLLVSSSVYTIDQKLIAKLKDNKLIEPTKFRQNISEKYLELFDERDFPVLQIDLDKKTNSIIINGLFYRRNGYMLISKEGLSDESYSKPYLLLSEDEKNKYLDESVELAKKLLHPIHE